MASLTLTVLGCGNSAGTPTIGNYWGKCDPAEPKNIRTRASVAIRSAATTLVVDTGTDFRQQINSNNIRDISAVLYTHAHGDHIHGIDELRVIRNHTNKYVNIYGDRSCLEEIQERFAYMFQERDNGIYPKVITSNIIEKTEYYKEILINDISFIPFEQEHGTCKTLGFRFGDLAYSTDMVGLCEKALETLAGIKTWVVDGAGYKMERNLVHATLKQVYALNEIVGATKVYLTHLTPSMDYKTLQNELPEGYAPAYDGLTLEIEA